MGKKKHPAEQYAHDVVKGKIACSKWVVLACKRYFADLKNPSYYFDREDADLYIEMMETFSLTEGQWAGRPFKQEPWQLFISWNLFGWKMKTTGLRRFTAATISVPKKTGKSEYGACLADTIALMDQEYGGQVYMAATAREQAAICFRKAKEMIKLSPAVQSYYSLMAHNIYIPSYATNIRAISSEASTAEGKGANVVIFDEEHEQATTDLKDNLRTGMAARQQPLFVSISTSGMDLNKPYYRHIKNCKQILSGILKDERHFIIIHTLDKEEDWKKESCWRQAIPNYGVSVQKDFIKSEFQKAINEPSYQPIFKTKYLNLWVGAAKTWISHDTWMKKADPKITFELMAGQQCWVGMDLASSRDFTVACFNYPQSNGEIVTLWRYYIPSEMANKRSDTEITNIEEWHRAGFIHITEGNVCDYNYIIEDIAKLRETQKIQSIAYDPQYKANPFVVAMMDRGFPMNGFSQAIMNMSTPTKEFEKMALSGNIIHDGNPVTAWMLSNVNIHRDANDNIKIHKGRSGDRVDGIVATVMAIGEHMEYSHKNLKSKSVYETRGVLEL